MSQSLDKDFDKLLTTMRGYLDKFDEDKVKSAWNLAKIAHTGQKRKTGDPYASHVLATAQNLASWRLDATSIIAGLLHDTIEDGGAKKADIEKQFGEEVYLLVDGVTKVSDLRLKEKKEEQTVENLRKLVLVMAKDLRVVLVKLADRLHNMQTLYALPEDKRKVIARETLEIYAPLAERLGIGEVKGELEDLAFPYLRPDEYRKLKKDSKSHYKNASRLVNKMKKILLKKLAKIGIKANIDTREKHLYSLWKKLERPGIEGNFDRVTDIVALRIIVDTVKECYLALGIVHDLYKPVPHKTFSDFIAQPKPNGYQSLHTSVFGPGNKVFEIQIRTHQMHVVAEYGVAAHWAYSEVKRKGKVHDTVMEKRGVTAPPSKLKWIKQLVKWQNEMADNKEFLKAVKFDAFSHRNFVFSPKGDVFDLPKEATPVDYAYAVHTGLGNYIKAAKVNGKIAPLNHKLKSGDIVEIIKTKNPKKPNKHWMDFVVTISARRGINKSLNKGR